MYKDAEQAIERITEIVAKCPKEYQAKCFELLLGGYVQHTFANVNVLGKPDHKQDLRQNTKADRETPALDFKNTAKRLAVPLEKLEAIFDFSIDPFTLHPLTLSGKNNAEKTRQAALIAASRSYLASGLWSADWKEVKSMCVDHNCYDAKNHAVNVKQGAGSIFKTVDPGAAIELSSDGIKEAEKLLKALAGGATE